MAVQLLKPANDNDEAVIWACSCGSTTFHITPAGFECTECYCEQNFEDSLFLS